MSNISDIISQITYNLDIFRKSVATNLADNYYTKEEIDGMSVTAWHAEIFDALPQTGSTEVLYLVRKADGTLDEYLWLGSAFEKIGQVFYDMRNYNTKEELQAALDLKADKPPTKISELENDLNYAYATVSNEKAVIGGIDFEDVAGTPDVVLQPYMDENYWTKAESLTKEEVEQGLQITVDLIDEAIKAIPDEGSGSGGGRV